MSYNPTTDYVGLWRSGGGGVSKSELPGLDFVAAALGRSGLLNITTSGSAPVSNQATTAWFAPATPSYSGEGALSLWNAVAVTYQTATARLLLEYLAASEKAAAVPTAISLLLDTLSATQGAVAFRGAAGWQALTPGLNGQVFTSGGGAANPSWTAATSSGAQLIGTTTNDSASVGNVGEYVENKVLAGSAVALTSGVAANICSISLTAGDWDVWGCCSCSWNGSSILTMVAANISLVTATRAAEGTTARAVELAGPTSAAFPTTTNTGVVRVSTNATINVFLVMDAQWTTGANSGYGEIIARRRR